MMLFSGLDHSCSFAPTKIKDKLPKTQKNSSQNCQKKSERMEIGVPGAGERKREEEERRVLERVGISGGKNGEF